MPHSRRGREIQEEGTPWHLGGRTTANKEHTREKAHEALGRVLEACKDKGVGAPRRGR